MKLAKLDEDFEIAFGKLVRNTAKSNGLLKEIKAHIIHEGRKTTIRRGTEAPDITEMKTASGDITTSFDDIENIDWKAVLTMAENIAKQMAEQQTSHMLNTMNEATKKTGQIYNSKGAPLTNEAILQLLSMMQINFENDTALGDISIVVPPAMIPTLQRLDKEFNESPELKKKMNQLLEKKRDEFREREANRNLVG